MQRVKTATASAEKPEYSATGAPGYFRSGDPVQGIPATVPGADWFNMVQEELMAVLAAAEIAPNATLDTQLAAAIVALAGQALAVHAAREDNPHGVTAGQVGAYTTVAVDTLLDALSASIASALAGKLGVNAQAADSAKLGGQLPAYYATAAALAAKLDANAQATDSAKLGGQLPAYYATATALAAKVALSDFTASWGTNGWVRLPNGLILQWGQASLVCPYGSATVTFPVAFTSAVYFAVCGIRNGRTQQNDGISGISTTQMTITSGSDNSVTLLYNWLAIGK